MVNKTVSRLWEEVELEYGKLLDEVSRRDPQSLTGMTGLDEYFASCPDAAQQFYIELAKTRPAARGASSISSESSDSSDVRSVGV